MRFQFESLAAFFYMNGHGVYVWTSYAIVYGILIYLILCPLLQKNQLIRKQKKWQQLQQNKQQP